MANCHLCNKHLGVFSSSKRMDGLRFCPVCAAAWPAERKKQVMEALCNGGEPSELFTIPGIKCKDPDGPARSVVIGKLAFTDKGICMIQVGCFRNADPVWGHLFGVIGAAAAAAAAKKREREAREIGEAHVLSGAQGFMDILTRSPRVIFFPIGTITKLRRAWPSSLIISVGKKKHVFTLEGGGRTWKQFRDRVEAYLATGKPAPAAGPVVGPAPGPGLAPNDENNPYRLR